MVNRYTPKAYTRQALKILVREIIEIKTRKDKSGNAVLSEQELDELRKLYLMAWNCGDNKAVYDIVKKLNFKKYRIGRMFVLTTQYIHRYGLTLILNVNYKV